MACNVLKLALVLICGVFSSPPLHARPPADVDGARIAAADSEPQNWLSHGRTYREERFSPLATLNKTNVKSLIPAWSFSFGGEKQRGQEAQPIIKDGVMYVTASYSRIYAVDLKTGGGGSPHVRTEWTIDGANISIEYGRPFLKGRTIGKEVAPYGTEWRTGADAATVITTDKPLKFGLGGTKTDAAY